MRIGGQAVRKGYRVGVVTFDSTARLVLEPSRDIGVVSRALEPVTAHGGTNLTEALEIATEHLGGHGGRRVVVATDGFPNNRATALKAAKSAARTGIEIITIGTEDADHAFLRVIATTDDFALAILAHQVEPKKRKFLAYLSQSSRRNVCPRVDGCGR